MVQDLLNIEARAVGQTQYANYLTVHRKGVPGVDDGEPLAYEIRCFPNHDQVHSKMATKAVMSNRKKCVPDHWSARSRQGMDCADIFHEEWGMGGCQLLLSSSMRQATCALTVTAKDRGCLWRLHSAPQPYRLMIKAQMLKIFMLYLI